MRTKYRRGPQGYGIRTSEEALQLAAIKEELRKLRLQLVKGGV